MRVALLTLGCKVNQYETQAMEQELLRRGHTLVGPEEDWDACIVNTCTVTAVSDKKSRQTVRHVRRSHPDGIVAVCGCYAQIDPDAAEKTGADLIAGTGDRIAFLDRLEKAVRGRCERDVTEASAHRDFELLPAGGLGGRTRAMLKIEDGCFNRCTYCIIPEARGPVRSMPPAYAVAEAVRMRSLGYREIVVTGIEISSYGRDLAENMTLTDLVEQIADAVPDLRIRLGSLEPRTVTDEFCERLAAHQNICPHFHLSLQSGSDTVLHRMGRRYDTARYFESVRRLRKAFHDPAVTCDLIVGFPGETDREFEETLAFLRKCGFASMHVFPYSRRPGTPAASMPDQVPKKVKEERAACAAAAAEETRRAYCTRWLGSTCDVLFEEMRGCLWFGHTPNYLGVLAQGEDLHNRIRTVHLDALRDGTVYGTICERKDDR